MIAFLLVTLFATIAVASVVTLADAAVRGRNAFRLVRGDMARAVSDRRMTVTFMDTLAETRMPALRPVRAGRESLRRTLRAPAEQPLRAAA